MSNKNSKNSFDNDFFEQKSSKRPKQDFEVERRSRKYKEKHFGYTSKNDDPEEELDFNN